MNYPTIACELDFSRNVCGAGRPRHSEPGDPELVPFKLRSPGARNVLVCVFFPRAAVGELVQGQPLVEADPMVRMIVPLGQAFAGYWSGHVALPPGRHEYLYLVDGAWAADPEATETCADGVGGTHCIRTVVAGEQLAAIARVATGFALAAHRAVARTG